MQKILVVGGIKVSELQSTMWFQQCHDWPGISGGVLEKFQHSIGFAVHYCL
jgi:hypothetical protein